MRRRMALPRWGRSRRRGTWSVWRGTHRRAPAMSAAVNQGGWAQWMGTSFATPVITALAANYLSNNPAASPDQVMRKLQSAGAMTDAALQVPDDRGPTGVFLTP